MTKVEGKGSIYAEVVKDSINNWGDRVTTFRLHYPRFIHAEFMTHRMISKNASSSRAIPVDKQLKAVDDNPAKPIHWGLNQPGMQATAEGDVKCILEGVEMTAEQTWMAGAHSSVEVAKAMWMDGAGYHKQIVNRVTEPYTFMNVVASGTEWENFFWLRCHKDAQPEIAELAHCMYTARLESEPQRLSAGEWHLPYVESFRDSMGMLQYCDEDGDEVYTLEEALKISASCCAQASYRSLDQSLEKAIMLFDRLAGGEPLHASPFEHPCMPYSEDEYMLRSELSKDLRDGLKRIHGNEMAISLSDINMYTGNFRGWTQYRKTMPYENIEKTFSY